MAAKELWVEKYRPRLLNDYVFRDEHQKKQIEGWIKEGSLPNLLFTGTPGTGKTTLAKVLINEVGVEEIDVLEVNASRTNGVDEVRDRITGFVQTMPFGDFKVVLLDEADYLTANGQAALRGLIEAYHSCARFIFTANYAYKIIPAIHSRCQGFHIETIDKVEYTARVATILVSEGIEFELDTLDTYVKTAYPDLRKCINMLQMNSNNNQLMIPEQSDSGLSDYKIEMVELFKKGQINKARKLLCSKARPEEMGDIYTWMYSNIELFGTSPEQQDNAILIIKQGLVDHSIIIDPEVNLAATLIRLARNMEQ